MPSRILRPSSIINSRSSPPFPPTRHMSHAARLPPSIRRWMLDVCLIGSVLVTRTARARASCPHRRLCPVPWSLVLGIWSFPGAWSLGIGAAGFSRLLLNDLDRLQDCLERLHSLPRRIDVDVAIHNSHLVR